MSMWENVLAEFLRRGQAAQAAVDKASRQGKGRTVIDNARLQGIAAALGELAGPQMEPDLALGVLESLGLTLADLREAGADPYDLKLLKGRA